MSNHTTGPWIYAIPGDSFVASDNGLICRRPAVSGKGSSQSNWDANASLIAAAPDLLKVLCMARAKIAAELQVMAMCHTAPDGMIDDAEMVLLIEAEQDLLNQIDAAIFKAIG